jgi:type IV pilus biogenesis protein CpaD/CtpE
MGEKVMARAILAVLTIVLLAGCAETDFTRTNTTEDQQRRDAAACRRAVSAQVQRDRNIDNDISTTVGAQSQQVRPGDTLTRQQIASRGDSVRSERLMENCMRARGYGGPGEAPKPAAPAPKP